MEEKIKEFLLSKLNCEAIILFGSFARGTQTAESDIDIAVKVKEKIDKKEIFKLSNELADLTGREIDLIDLDNIGDTFRYEILVNGKTLFCEDEFKFELYKLDMYREFLDLNESRQAIVENIKNGGNIYGK